MKRTNKKLITLNERNLDMIDAIIAETGWDTPTQVLKRGLEELYKQTFKYGKNPLTDQSYGDDDETIRRKAEQKVKEKKAIQDAENEQKLQPKKEMCINLLGGEVTKNEAGDLFCSFMQHRLKEDVPLMLPLGQVSPMVAETSLYLPSKDAVLKARKDLN